MFRMRPAALFVSAVVVLATVAGAAFVGTILAGGGSPQTPPPAGSRPPSPPPCSPGQRLDVPGQPCMLQPGQPYTGPTQAPYPGQPVTTWPPPRPLIISGVEIPLPPGATAGSPSDTTQFRIERGISFVWFDDKGLSGAKIASADEADFGATLDVLWALAQKNGDPAPASVVVASVLVPLPAGARHNAAQNPFQPDDTSHLVRWRHSVLAFNGRGIQSDWIAPEDAADFQPTVDVLWTMARNRPVSARPSITMRGVDVPVPPGAEYRTGDPNDPIHLIERANSWVSFDEAGIKVAEIQPRDKADFQPTLDALLKLAAGP